MKYSEQVNPQGQRADWWLPGDAEGGNGEKLLNGYRIFFWRDENVLELEVVVTQHCKCTDTTEMLTLNGFYVL